MFTVIYLVDWGKDFSCIGILSDPELHTKKPCFKKTGVLFNSGWKHCVLGKLCVISILQTSVTASSKSKLRYSCSVFIVSPFPCLSAFLLISWWLEILVREFSTHLLVYLPVSPSAAFHVLLSLWQWTKLCSMIKLFWWACYM